MQCNLFPLLIEILPTAQIEAQPRKGRITGTAPRPIARIFRQIKPFLFAVLQFDDQDTDIRLIRSLHAIAILILDIPRVRKLFSPNPQNLLIPDNPLQPVTATQVEQSKPFPIFLQLFLLLVEDNLVVGRRGHQTAHAGEEQDIED